MAPNTTIEFHDAGPDKLDRRQFTLRWPTEPRTEVFRGRLVTTAQRAQVFFSAQWHQFLAEGAVEVTL